MPIPNSTLPVLVAGAGPTGMTAALELSRFHVPLRIIDKLDEPATTSRAIGVQARTLELLEMRGLADQFVNIGDHAYYGNVYGGGKRLLQLDFSHLDSSYKYLLFISQVETERILREALERQRVQIERGVEIVSFSQTDTSVRVTQRRKDGRTEDFNASYLIGAEGAHSVVRTTLGLTFEGKTFDQTYVLGDLHVDTELCGTEAHIFASEHGFVTLFPLGKGRFRLIADHPLSNPHNGSPPMDECQSLYNQRAHIAARFHDMTWSSYFHINSRMVSLLRVGRVFLGGDAAHVHSPAGGQGMNTGIQDMINLGWKLAYTMHGYGSPELLDTYQADRIPVMRDVLQKTEKLTDVISAENRYFRALFNHLVPLIGEKHFVQENASERMSQLAVNYRDSSLSEDHGPSLGIHAGDRVPNVRVRLVGTTAAGQDERIGSSVPLFDLLDPSRITVTLAGEPATANENSVESCLRNWAARRPYLQFLHLAEPHEDNRRHFARVFGEGPSISRQPLVFLIRPDGYVGFRGSAAPLDRLDAYLNRWLDQQPTAQALNR